MNDLNLLIDTLIVCLIILTCLAVAFFLLHLFRLSYNEYYLRRLEKENNIKKELLDKLDKGILMDYDYYRYFINKNDSGKASNK